MRDRPSLFGHLLGAVLVGLVAPVNAEPPVPAERLLEELIQVAELPFAEARAPGRRFGSDRAVCDAAPTELRDATFSCETRVHLRGRQGAALPGRLRAWWRDTALLAWELQVEGRGQAELRASAEARFGPACRIDRSTVIGPMNSGPAAEWLWHLDGPLIAVGVTEAPGEPVELVGIGAAARGHEAGPAHLRCDDERAAHARSAGDMESVAAVLLVTEDDRGQ